MRITISVVILIIIIGNTILFASNEPSSQLAKFDSLYEKGNFQSIIKGLVPDVNAYERGEESFLTETTITHARNLVADSYRMLENYTQASLWYASTIDGHDDSYSAYCFEVLRQISIINGELFKIDPWKRYQYSSITTMGIVLIELMDNSSFSQKQKYFRDLIVDYNKNDWDTKLIMFCAGDLKFEDLWLSTPKYAIDIASTYAGLSLELRGKITEAGKLYRKALAQKGSKNIEVLLAANRLGLLNLKMIYTNENSIYRLTNVYQVKTTSAKLEGKQLYSIRNLIDDDPKTAWVPDSQKSGIGEWAEISFDDPMPVNSITITNGYAKSDAAFKNNNRVKTATLEFSDGSQQKVTLKDTMQPQTIQIGKSTQKVRLTINEVYKGAKYDDTCLSGLDVQFEAPKPTQEGN